MRMNKMLLASLLVMAFTNPAFSHGDHHKIFAGTVGSAVGIGLNLLELAKHGFVVVDQVQSDERNSQVLLGNALVGAAHIINAKAFLDDLSHGAQNSRFAVPLMFIASSFNFADLYVDGITAWEYWSKESSWQNIAVMLAAPTCFALNLHMLIKHAIKPKTN